MKFVRCLRIGESKSFFFREAQCSRHFFIVLCALFLVVFPGVHRNVVSSRYSPRFLFMYLFSPIFPPSQIAHELPRARSLFCPFRPHFFTRSLSFVGFIASMPALKELFSSVWILSILPLDNLHNLLLNPVWGFERGVSRAPFSFLPV